MYRITYINFSLKRVKFQYNNTIKHNLQHSVCIEISQLKHEQLELSLSLVNSQCEL